MTRERSIQRKLSPLFFFVETKTDREDVVGKGSALIATGGNGCIVHG